MEEIKFTKFWKNMIIGTAIVSALAFLMSSFMFILTVSAINSNPNAKYAKIVISKKYDKGQSLEKALEAKKPIIAFFYVDWCGYCKRFAPQFHKITKKKDFKKEYSVAYINCEAPENEKTIKDFAIQGFPTVFLIESDGDKKQIQVSDFYRKDFLELID